MMTMREKGAANVVTIPLSNLGNTRSLLSSVQVGTCGQNDMHTLPL